MISSAREESSTTSVRTMPSSRKRARRASQAPKSRLSKVGEAGAPCSSTGAPATDERISATKSLTARRSRASDAPSSLASCSSSSASSSSSPYAESARASTSRGASSSPPLAALSLHWFSTAASASAARAMCATQSAGGECASTDGVPERRCLSSRSAERTVSRHAHAGATSGDEQGDFVRAGAASASHASCWIACCSCCASAPSSAAAAVSPSSRALVRCQRTACNSWASARAAGGEAEPISRTTACNGGPPASAPSVRMSRSSMARWLAKCSRAPARQPRARSASPSLPRLSAISAWSPPA
mmetsp:Transcript_20157/g.61331  ORF Transcript_20157/g.61331 Transcript_20157/m.61331 type:complete len:303 (-) Transcript_20157:116-1024(-)